MFYKSECRQAWAEKTQGKLMPGAPELIVGPFQRNLEELGAQSLQIESKGNEGPISWQFIKKHIQNN